MNYISIDNLPANFILANPAVSPDRIHDQLKAEDMKSYSTGELFPNNPHVGVCRVCGETKPLTKEHLPPKAAFNKGRGRMPSFGDLLNRDELTIPETGKFVQSGNSGYVLCKECNNYTGTHWGNAYKKMTTHAVSALNQIPGGYASADEKPGYSCWQTLEFKDVNPGRYIRQVIAMMLVMAGDASLGDRYPALRRLVLGGDPEQLPEPLRLYVSITPGPMARFIGGPRGQLWVKLDSGERRWLLAVDCPPLAHVLLLDGPVAPELGSDISELSQCEVNDNSSITFENMPLGFTHVPWPTDYRTKAKILLDCQAAGGLTI